jgi:hypothetical protein
VPHLNTLPVNCSLDASYSRTASQDDLFRAGSHICTSTTMQGYYQQSPYYPQPQLNPQQLAAFPYVQQHVPGQYMPADSFTAYQRHRYETYVPPPPEPVQNKRHSIFRSNTVSTPHTKTRPLKSALKRRPHERSESLGPPVLAPSTGPPAGPPISRQTSRAPSEPRERTGSTSRSRANSLSQFTPGALLVPTSCAWV